MDLVAESYRLTANLPKTETYGLASQIQRSAVSIPANIAEGQGREHLGDYLRQVSIANGLLMELETRLLLVSRLAFVSAGEVEPLLEKTGEVSRTLIGLTSLKQSRSASNT